MTSPDIRKGGRHRKPRPPRLRIFRSGVFRRAAAATAATTAVATLTGPTASATPDVPPPPVGFELQLNVEAKDVPLTVHGDELSRDFAGTFTARVVSRDPDDPWKLNFTIVNLDVTSEDNGDGYGRLNLGNTDGASTPDSTVHVTSQDPPQWEAMLNLDFTMDIEKPHHVPNSVALSTVEPARLSGMGTDFPPQGEPFTLQDPIRLASSGDPDNVVAEFAKFPLQISG